MASRPLTKLLMWLVLVGFGLSYGLSYGVANHTFYLLPAVRALDPQLWRHDWAVTATHHYHFVFAWLASALLSLDPSGWILALSNVLTIAGGMACVWALLRLLVSAEQALLALLVVVVVASGTRTGGPGTSYVFSGVFQPSSLGAVGLLAAVWLTVSAKPLASGLVLAATGAVHANYLVLSLPVFGVAQLVLGRAGLVKRLLQQLGPLCLVLLLYLPTMRATSVSPVAAEAQRIYQDIRSPHHYRIETFWPRFVPWAGWQLLGAVALSALGKPSSRRALAVLSGFWALILPSLVLALLVVRPVIQLYAWRLTSNAELLCQAAFAAWLVSHIATPDELPKPPRARVALLGLGVLLIALGVLQSGNYLALLVAALGSGLLLGSGSVHARLVRALRAPRVPSAVLLLALALANVSHVRRFSENSSLLGGRDLGVAELCRWTDTNTSRDDVLLSPPQEEAIRFQCRRAIVVDWKTAPMVPGEVLDWYRRIEDVVGRSPLHSQAELSGYLELDRERLARLREKYHFDYFVTYRSARPVLGLTPVFLGQRFVVYRLGPGPW